MLDTVTINYDDLKYAIARMKELDPKLKLKMQRELRTKLRPMAEKIAGAVPSSGPLSGMTPRWGTAKGKVQTATGRRAGGAIVMLSISGPGFEKMLSITELAGSRSSGYTPAGKAMITELQKRYPLAGKGGRFIWKTFLGHQPFLYAAASDIVNDFIDEANAKTWGK